MREVVGGVPTEYTEHTEDKCEQPTNGRCFRLCVFCVFRGQPRKIYRRLDMGTASMSVKVWLSPPIAQMKR